MANPVRRVSHRRLLALAAGWLVLALAACAALRGGDLGFLAGGAGLVRDIALANVLILTGIVAVVTIAGIRGHIAPLTVRRMGLDLMAAVLFFAGFSMLKASMPLVLPFFADPLLARLDAALHGGTDPWRLAHALLPHPSWALISEVYVDLWLLPAIGFPVALAAVEPDPGRHRRFLALFAFCWVGLGLVAALGGLSVGPVYYDRLVGGARFAALSEALARSGIGASNLGGLQDHLWFAYADAAQSGGSGISAFPSVHVAIAAVYMLYLGERSRWLLIPGVAYLAAILFLSVYTGYHYALDGYTSILLILLVWIALRRFGPFRIAA